IPEAGNGVNDLLDEARYEIEFLLKMQIPDGVKLRVPVGAQTPGQPLTLTEIDAGGMAHHKVHDARWTGIPLAPADDHETRLLYPPSTGATLNLAAVGAQCARIWREIDPAFARQCLAASQRAFRASLRNRDVRAGENFAGGGAYGDND
ncbi:glycoside hydrolase family 9 protein, partial [Klebsiella pneumoniae]|uniref:glycoside hydrolase family 9 protein n=1 Tax=Klebsiella pneumoniae TaxID=573 RepID=UPI00273A4615